MLLIFLLLDILNGYQLFHISTLVLSHSEVIFKMILHNLDILLQFLNLQGNHLQLPLRNVPFPLRIFTLVTFHFSLQQFLSSLIHFQEIRDIWECPEIFPLECLLEFAHNEIIGLAILIDVVPGILDRHLLFVDHCFVQQGH